jgi:hypothetical protein
MAGKETTFIQPDLSLFQPDGMITHITTSQQEQVEQHETPHKCLLLASWIVVPLDNVQATQITFIDVQGTLLTHTSHVKHQVSEGFKKLHLRVQRH